MLIGAHVSQAGGLHLAVQRGGDIGATSIQIFSQSPRMWKPTAYSDDDYAEFRAAREPTKIKAVLIHAVYLINTATDDREMRSKSLASLVQSLRVGDGIGADAVVLHAGSAKGTDLGRAIKRAGKVIAEALAQTERCELHLEDTAGAGGTLGRSFEELAQLIEAGGADRRLGICLDSCHLLASGYEVRTPAGLDETLASCDRAVGLERLRSLHLNDSLTPLGSNRDRHAPPGDGEFGESGLAVFVSEPRFDSLACVLETGHADGGVNADDIALVVKLRKRGIAARKRRAPRADR